MGIQYNFFRYRYAELIEKAQERRTKLEESIKQHGMLREAKEVESWIQDKVVLIDWLIDWLFDWLFD